MRHVGLYRIRSNHGMMFSNDDDALEHAFSECNIEPSEDIGLVDREFVEMFLEWFYSHDWIRREEAGRYDSFSQ